MFGQKSQSQKEEKPVYKYYMEVVGASKELYTVKANDMDISSYGCYTFILDGNVIASYPIYRTIIKSIELKSE